MIPKKVVVLGIPYQIVVAPHADMGSTAPDTQIITIAPNQGPDQERRTVVHEVVHAVVETTGLARWLGDHEEQFVSFIDNALLQVIRDNPRLIEYLSDAK